RAPRCPLFPYTPLFRSAFAELLLIGRHIGEALFLCVGTVWQVFRHHHGPRGKDGIVGGFTGNADEVEGGRAMRLVDRASIAALRSEEHTSELQSRENLV